MATNLSAWQCASPSKMLRLVGKEGEEFRLHVLRYQYPDIVHDEWDSNWLIVAGEVSCPRGRWRFSNSCLCAVEIKALADWLRDVAGGRAERELGFIEPNLRFELVEAADGPLLSVVFSQECAPPWATESERYGDGVALRFPFRLNDLIRAAEVVRGMSAEWPVRGRTPRQ